MKDLSVFKNQNTSLHFKQGKVSNNKNNHDHCIDCNILSNFSQAIVFIKKNTAEMQSALWEQDYQIYLLDHITEWTTTIS